VQLLLTNTLNAMMLLSNQLLNTR